MKGIPSCRLPDGTTVARLGIGTWHMGENRSARAAEVAAVRLAIDLGMTLVDTAEMYGDGGAEEVVGEAIRGQRERVFVVSKFYPHHASRKKLLAACDATRTRLDIDTLDLYLYHWRGNVQLAETVDALESLVAAGAVARWGVSNFDVDDMSELLAVPGGGNVAVNQVLYNLDRRGPEFELMPLHASRGIATMAYSPVDEGRLLRHKGLAAIASRIGVSAAQVAIAWLVRRPDVIAIPKAVDPAHVHDNRAAADLVLDEATLAELDRLFAPPSRRQPLEMI
ncbi:putative oxidoreductase [Usitatibacter rugosus]|uniref:Putative oxidoreductase n=1 Tax=Usitatibacter rugosus TaxID=2732067 RepID=A0A6M4GSK3_9PROT|nr:aldo/keto reductase [Usitatibacter rugosus]QJR10279.1 putative oxidoreductase [Usitatibacter rugosus]